jgi:hypothetical protein
MVCVIIVKVKIAIKLVEVVEQVVRAILVKTIAIKA